MLKGYTSIFPHIEQMPHPSPLLSQRLLTLTIVGAAGFLAAFNLYAIWSAASPYPYTDDWNIIASWGEANNVGLNILFEPCGDFYKPIEQVLHLMTLYLNGGDYRLALIISYLPLVACAFISLEILRRHRPLHLYDLCVPLTLLSPAGFKTFSWFTAAWGSMSAAVLTTCSLLVLYAGKSRSTRVSLAILVIIGMGVSILTVVGLVAIWLACALSRNKSSLKGASGTAPSSRAWLVGMAAWALYTGFFLWAHAEEGKTDTFDPGSAANAALQYVSMSLGVISKKLWPLSGLLILVLMSAAAFVAWTPRTARNAAWVDVAVPLLAISPVLMAAPMLGLARHVQGCLMPRYVVYACPLMVALYAMFRMHAKQSVAARACLGILFMYSTTSFWYDFQIGWTDIRESRERVSNIRSSLAAGADLTQLFADNNLSLTRNRLAPLSASYPILRQLGAAPWASLPEYEYSITPVAIEPTSVIGFTSSEGKWLAGGDKGARSWLNFTYPLQQVDFVKVELVVKSKSNASKTRAEWGTTTQSALTPRLASDQVIQWNSAKLTRDPAALLVRVGAETDFFALSPSTGHYEVHIAGITLMRRL